MKHTQRITALFATFFLMSSTLFSQCCPYIYGLEIVPSNPQSTDEIQVFTQVATPNNGAFINHDFYLQNDTLFINACYFSGFLTVITEIPDTITIGQLPEGEYVVSFTASQSANELQCIVASSQNTISYLTVGAAAAIPDNDLSMNSIYPNPAQTHLTVTNSTNDTQILVYDLKGSLIELPILFSNESAILDLNGLVAGWYHLVQVGTTKSPVHYSFCKE